MGLSVNKDQGDHSSKTDYDRVEEYDKIIFENKLKNKLLFLGATPINFIT